MKVIPSKFDLIPLPLETKMTQRGGHLEFAYSIIPPAFQIFKTKSKKTPLNLTRLEQQGSHSNLSLYYL